MRGGCGGGASFAMAKVRWPGRKTGNVRGMFSNHRLHFHSDDCGEIKKKKELHGGILTGPVPPGTDVYKYSIQKW